MAAPSRPGAPLSTVAVLGAGAVGARVARQIVTSDSVDKVVLRDTSRERLARVSRVLGDRCRVEHAPFTTPLEADAVVVASRVAPNSKPCWRLFRYSVQPYW